jgi:hypothetical protein
MRKYLPFLLALGMVTGIVAGTVQMLQPKQQQSYSNKTENEQEPKTMPSASSEWGSNLGSTNSQTIKPLQVPNDAVQLAWMDIQTIPLFDRLFIRYIWISTGSNLSLKITSLAMNYISRGTIIQKPLPVVNGYLVRIDLRQYAPRREDIRQFAQVWEELAFDPAFALLLTKDTLAFADKGNPQVRQFQQNLPRKKIQHPTTKRVKIPATIRKESREIEHPGGKFIYPDDSGRVVEDAKAGRYLVNLEFNIPEQYEEKTETIEAESLTELGKKVDVVRLDGQHLDGITFDRLKSATGSLAPIVEYRYFLTRALSTIKTEDPNKNIEEENVFKTIFGGLYYEFRGIKKAKDVLGKDTQATDQDLYFQNFLGIGNIQGKLNAKKLFDQLRSDQRALETRSNVTGKPRVVSFLPTLSTREGISWGAITLDIKDERIDLGDRPFANLLDPKFQAQEALFPGINGLQTATLFNDKGVLQDEVPFNVANDTTIPNPYTKRLQPIISCIRCHGGDGSDGLKPVVNRAKQVLNGNLTAPEVFGDLSAGNKAFDSDTIDRLAGLYTGNFSKNLRRGRDDIAEATLKATGPWKDGIGDQTDVVKLSTNRLQEDYADYVFTMVDTQKALSELGIECSKEIAQKVFNLVLPPDTRSPVFGIVGGQPIYPEDPRIGWLRQGVAIPRTDWALVESFALERSAKNRIQLLKQAEVQKR